MKPQHGSLALLLLLAGCGGDGGKLLQSTTVEPAPLIEIESPIAVQKRWSSSIGGGWGSDAIRGLQPVLQDGRLYLAAPNGQLAVLDAHSGKRLQRMKAKRISAGPGVGEGLILVGTREAQVRAYAEQSGKLVWETTLTGEVLSSPRIADAKVLVRTLDGKLFALSATDGRTLWVYTNSVPALSLYGTSAPLVYGDDSTVLAGFDSGQLLNLEINSGLPIWELEIATPSGSSDLERMIDIDAELQPAGNNLLVSSYQGRLAMVNILTGQIAWSHSVSSFNRASYDADAGTDGQVYVADEKGRLIALHAITGELLWEHEQLLNRNLSAPIAYAGYVVCPDGEGYLHWFHSHDGSPAGRTRLSGKHTHATTLVHEDLLIVHARGKVVAFSVP